MRNQKMIARGIRNHNPGNIRLGTKWDGLADKQTDPSFCVFKSNVYGCRALLKLLKTYVTKYNCNTITKIISRWAPSHENNTSVYILYVANKINKGTTEPLSFNKVLYIKIAKAIAYQENGTDAKMISEQTWEDAYALI